MKDKKTVYGLGTAFLDKKVYLFFCTDNDLERGTFSVSESEDGMTCSTVKQNAKIVDITGPSDEIGKCDLVHISKDGKYYYLTYRLCEAKTLSIAQSKNFIDWEKFSHTTIDSSNGKIVSDYLYAGRNVMIVGGKTLCMYVSEDLRLWTRVKKDLIVLDNLQENDEIIVVETQVVEDGVLVVYAVLRDKEGIPQYELHIALFDYGDPTRLSWKSKHPIYTTQNSQEDQIKLFGAIVFDDYLVSYWANDNDMLSIRHFYSQDKYLKDEI